MHFSLKIVKNTYLVNDDNEFSGLLDLDNSLNIISNFLVRKLI